MKMRTNTSIKEYAAWALLALLVAGACARPGGETRGPAPAEGADGEEGEEPRPSPKIGRSDPRRHHGAPAIPR